MAGATLPPIRKDAKLIACRTCSIYAPRTSSPRALASTRLTQTFEVAHVENCEFLGELR